MAIWHKQVSTGIDSVVDNPEVVALYRRWMAQYALRTELPALEDFSPEHLADVAPRLMQLRPEGEDFRYVYYGREIARHADMDATGACVSSFGGEIGDFFLDRYRHVMLTQQPLYTVHFSDRARSVVTWERLILPVRDAQREPWLIVYNTPLQSRQQLLETVLNATSDGILALRAMRTEPEVVDWLVIVANRQFCELFGTTLDDAIGRPVQEAFPPWPQLGLQAQCRAVMAQASGISSEVTLALGGVSRCFMAHVGPLDDGCVLRLTDVTERKQAEETLRISEERLREAQKLEAVGTLARGIAHDFNNIVGAMLANVVLALQDVGPAHPARLALDELLKSGLRAKDLVAQILTFGRQGNEPFVKLPLRPVLEEVAQSQRAQLQHGGRISVDCADRPGRILANPSQVHQLLMNLCTNARHAIESRGAAGRIDLQLDETRLDEAAAALLPGLSPGLYVLLRVADNGIGMDESTRGRIFEPFFTTKAVGKGTGLGLSVVHGIVTAHGGAIAVSSTLGQGTRFEVFLPALEPSAEPTVPGGLDELQGHGEHVLCVDDDHTMLLVLQRMLERGGYRVSAFDNPQQALAAVRADPQAYDVVVTDYNMPGQDGVQLADELTHIRSGLPIVMYSGYISDELRLAARYAGVCRIVPKANSYDELPAVVRQVLLDRET